MTLRGRYRVSSPMSICVSVALSLWHVFRRMLLVCTPAVPTTPAARHLVLVTIDTLRADRLGAYGNANVATPNMDRLAQQGAMALHASAHVPLTRPSHVSLFTGLYPSEHGIRDNVSPPLGKQVPVLAELLQQRGFRTAGFVSSIVLSKQSGLGSRFPGVFGLLRDRRGRRPLSEHDPEARRSDGGGGDRVAARTRIRSALRVGASLRSA